MAPAILWGHLANNGRGEIMPGAGTGGGQVIDASQVRDGGIKREGDAWQIADCRLLMAGRGRRILGRGAKEAAGEHVGRGLGDEAAPSGASNLVAHDAEFFPFSRQALDRAEEIVAAGAIDPAEAKDQVEPIHLLHRLVTGLLGAPVGAKGIGMVCFEIGFGLRAVENIIRGVVDEKRPGAFGFFRKDTRGYAVDLHGQFGLGFGLVHGGVGSGVDDDMGRDCAHASEEGVRIREVHLRDVHAGDGPKRRQCAGQFPADLAVSAQNENAGKVGGG